MSFPVDVIQPDLLSAVDGGKSVLLRAPTGSGKSTRVPGMLCDHFAGDGLILVVQPRRMAARLLAGFVAKERGSQLGGEVGYAVRFDAKWGRETRILYLTDGVLQRWLNDEPGLPGVKAVIFDEFHERRLASDVALGRCMDLVKKDRSDLQVIVMSATIKTQGLEEYLAPCEVIEATGRTYPVDIHYASSKPVLVNRGGRRVPEGLWDTVARALKKELGKEQDGHVLVFLPGVHEIRRTCEILNQSSWANGWEIAPLYSAMPPAEQAKAVRSGGNPRIIVSTNVAETSVTIDGVTLVIDAGYARQAAFDFRRGFDSLTVQKISRAAADQRAGRAGRTRPGRCLRLWSEADHTRRQEFETPEVKRVDLAECALQLAATGWPKLLDFPWLEAPEAESLKRATELLKLLEAINNEGELTHDGKKMVGLPLHPRLARLILAGEAYGCVAEACFAAALLQGEGLFLRGKGGREQFQEETDTDDFTAEFLAYEYAVRSRFDPQICGRNGILGRAARELQQSLSQLRKLSEKLGLSFGDIAFHRRFEEFGKAMLVAYSDRVAVRVSQSTLACRVSGGRKGQLEPDSAVKVEKVFLATEMTEVEGRDLTVKLGRCVTVQEEWLSGNYPEDLHDRAGAHYDDSRRRVIGLKERCFRDLVLERDERGEPDPERSAELLAERVLSGELVLKKWNDGVEQWIARLANLSEWMPELELPGFSDDDKHMAIAQMCLGKFSYKEIKEVDPWPVLREWLSPAQHAALDSFTPERITLVNGQTPKVRYEKGSPPVIALKVQQLYDVPRTPKIANETIPVMVHICGPNMRPWQMTQDLESFWENGFSQMKKDLAGRYPKHDWR